MDPTINPQEQYEGSVTQEVRNLLLTVDFTKENLNGWAIIDSGATINFLVTEAPVADVVTAHNPLTVTIPDGSRVQSTYNCKISIADLPDKVQLGHIIPGLASHSLILVVTLCNARCEVLFTKIKCIVTYRGQVVLTGWKCCQTGLWMIPLTPEGNASPHSDHNAYNMCQQEFVATSFSCDFTANIIPTSNKEELV